MFFFITYCLCISLTSIEEFLNDIAKSGCSLRYEHSRNIGWNLPSVKSVNIGHVWILTKMARRGQCLGRGEITANLHE